MSNGIERIEIPLSEAQIKKIKSLSALGYTASVIARMLELQPEEAKMFCYLARLPRSGISTLIQTGILESNMRAETQLLSQAEGGDVDAFVELQKVKNRNHYFQIIDSLDEDEFSFARED